MYRHLVDVLDLPVRFAVPVIMMKWASCSMDPAGACCARVMHSSIGSHSTGRVGSRRRRTARVVRNASSVERLSVAMHPPPYAGRCESTRSNRQPPALT
jgi:hypothetical protein